MIDESRINIYDFLYNVFYGTVTKNVYAAREPQELTKSDVKDGFVVLIVGELNDASEFKGETYGSVRCYVEAYIPPISRGRLDYDKYSSFENAINDAISTQIANSSNNDKYHIQESATLTSDIDGATVADNTFFTFIKSFIVYICS